MSFNTRVQFILAVEENGGIGYKDWLPWPKLKTDWNHFKKTTIGTPNTNAVILGRKTFITLPKNMRPLPNRRNFVLTRDISKFKESYPNKDSSIDIYDSIDTLIQYFDDNPNKYENIFVLGGAQIFRHFMTSKYKYLVEKIYFTRIKKSFQCDSFFHFDLSREGFAIDSEFSDQEDKKFCDNNVDGQIELWWNKSINEEEFQYLDLCKDIMKNGYFKVDRTKVGTFSKFGVTMRFDLSSGRIPLFTTKRVFLRGIIEELLWFLKGDTNSKNLSKKGVKIWDGNGSREFLDRRGLTERKEGDLGPVYGFQWRHFNAKYEDCETDYSGKGVDQIQGCIDTIRNNPGSRRIIFTAWNPCQIPEMALPPCHLFCQFFVVDYYPENQENQENQENPKEKEEEEEEEEEGEKKEIKKKKRKRLDCLMYQRSGDLGLGVPFNVASYSILSCMMSQICGLDRGEFIHVLGDAHVYKSHVDALKKQVRRIPRKFPILELNEEIKKIEMFEYKDFTVTGYKPHKKIKMEMAL